MNGLYQTAKHVKDPGAGCMPVFDHERAAFKGAERKHRVMVTEDQYFGIATS